MADIGLAAPAVSAGHGVPHPTIAGAKGGRHASRGTAPGAAQVASRLLHPTAETYLALGVVAIVALLVMPLPGFLLDLFLAVSFALSLVVLFAVLGSRDPLEFSIFPSLLLLLTLFRLGLNVSSTRLILSTGHAGKVIAAFGNFVIGGNYIVGLVIFLILVVINFMVITKGAGRIAEVAARFTLDAMPGRQMSIDADLSAGLIDETEAKRRREEITKYSDFFGSMDGAAKFVRGDAVAGLLITGINLIGGFLIGMLQHHMTASEALTTYTSLTVGDGLVTQIPALIVSTSAGLLVTYGSGGVEMAGSLGTQLTRSPRALWTTAGLLAFFALMPGLPKPPFLLLAGLSGALADYAGKRPPAETPASRAAAAAGHSGEGGDGTGEAMSQPVKDLLVVEPLELEVGYQLVPLVDHAQGGDLLQRVSIMRKQLALELGMIVPPTRIRDNIQLPACEYVIKLRGIKVAGGELMPRQLLALNINGTAVPLDGVPTTDPSFGMPAFWIQPDQRPGAEDAGYSVVEAHTVLVTHLMETVREHAADLLSRQDVRELLDGLKETHPALVDDVVPAKIGLGIVHRVLQRLLKESIPIRDLVSILEALSDAADLTKDPEALTEHVRRALSLVIVQMLGAGDQALEAITLGPRLEVGLMQLFGPRGREGQRSMEPDELSDALRGLHDIALTAKRDGQYPPLITPPGLRVGVRRLLEPILPKLPVISLAELPSQTPIQSLATWEVRRAA